MGNQSKLAAQSDNRGSTSTSVPPEVPQAVPRSMPSQMDGLLILVMKSVSKIATRTLALHVLTPKLLIFMLPYIRLFRIVADALTGLISISVWLTQRPLEQM